MRLGSTLVGSATDPATGDYVIRRVDSRPRRNVPSATAQWQLTPHTPRPSQEGARSQMQMNGFTGVAAKVLRTRLPLGAADAGDVCPS